MPKSLYVGVQVAVALFTRAWIEIEKRIDSVLKVSVALFTRAWIEIACLVLAKSVILSPSSRGRGLKFIISLMKIPFVSVALFTRAWIEMIC